MVLAVAAEVLRALSLNFTVQTDRLFTLIDVARATGGGSFLEQDARQEIGLRMTA